jgi:hypothetical protein
MTPHSYSFTVGFSFSFPRKFVPLAKLWGRQKVGSQTKPFWARCTIGKVSLPEVSIAKPVILQKSVVDVDTFAKIFM